MKKIRKICSIVALTSLMVTLIGCGKKDVKRIDYDYSHRIESGLLVEEGVDNKKDLCLVTTIEDRFFSTNIVPTQKYFIFHSKKGKEETISYDKETGTFLKFERMDLNIFDMFSKKLVKTIDVKKHIDEVEGYQYDWYESPYSEKGVTYIAVGIKEIPKKGAMDGEEKTLCINLETEETCVKEKNYYNAYRGEEYVEYARHLSVFNWEGYDLLKANGYSKSTDEEEGERWLYCGISDIWEDMAYVSMTSNYLPEENKALYTKFPELEQYKGKDGYRVLLYISDSPSAQELTNLFFEEKKEVIFEGAVLKSEQSIDGQEHEICSLEDYDQWRKADLAVVE